MGVPTHGDKPVLLVRLTHDRYADKPDILLADTGNQAPAEAVTIPAHHTIALAHQADPHETRCTDCGVSLGYLNDPETDHPVEIEDFYLTPDGRTYCTDHAPGRHRHEYRADLSAWWCTVCETNTDYCQQTNPH